MSRKYYYSFFAMSMISVAGCSSDNNSSTALSGDNSTLTAAARALSVSEAISDFPNALLPRFALNNSEVTAAEVFRRIETAADGTETLSFGVEGANTDETLEREARYSSTSELLESVSTEPVDVLPVIIEETVRSQNADAPIEEIERTDSNGVVAWAVLLDANGSELEINVADDGTFLFVEEEIELSDLPADIANVLDEAAVAGSANLPDSSIERVTFADNTIQYAVEYESDLGQSLTVVSNAQGQVIRVEHEDSLIALSTSDTVEEAIADFPDTVVTEFANAFPEVTAAEIFRSQLFVGGAISETQWGIEGLSDDESVEVEALYNSAGVLLESATGTILDSLPESVATAFAARFPDVEIDEISQVEEASGTSYAVAFIQAGEELEANFDANGGFLSLEDILEEDQIPVQILTIIGNERVVLPIVEFEAVDAADGTRTFTVEYENEEGDSISYKLSLEGAIQSIDHEAPFNQ